MEKTIRDEMDSDMEDIGMPQGEIESCLNHWSNKYEILPNSELTHLRAENERLIQALRIAIKEKYQLSKREQSFVERMQNEGKPLPEQIKKRAMDYLKICSIVGSKVWSI